MPAREESAPADADQEDVEIRNVFEQLERDRALTRDHVRIVVRRHERGAAFARDRPGEFRAIHRGALVEDHFGAVFARRRDLGCRRVEGHDDDGGRAQQVRRERYALRVVAARKGHHAAGPRAGVELRDPVIGAAELERAHALQVFTLQKDARSRARVERARGDDRRAMRHAA